MQNQIHRGAKGLPRDRQRIAVVCRRLGRQGELDYWLKNQEVTSINEPLGQYVDFQAVRYCGKEGI